MKKRTHRHKLQFEAFNGYAVVVMFVDDVAAELVKLCPEEKREDNSETGAVTISSGALSVVIFPHKPAPGVIAHESYHVIAALLRWAGAQPEEEVIAYHLQYLVQNFTKWGAR